MTPLVSVIIPTKNSAKTLGACIDSVLAQSYENIECIVVDNGSSDATKEIAEAKNVSVLSEGNERSMQRNVGAARARGDFLMFIDSDMELGRELIAECVAIAMQHSSTQAIVIPEESFGTTFWARCKQFERSCYEDVPWLSAVRFFRKNAFYEAGAFDEQIVGGDDFDIHARVAAKFGTSAIMHAKNKVRHNEGDLTLASLLQKKYYYGKTIALYGRKRESKHYFSLQANPITRTLLFLSHPKQILHHPLLFGGTCIMKWLELMALGLGHMRRNTVY